MQARPHPLSVHLPADDASDTTTHFVATHSHPRVADEAGYVDTLHTVYAHTRGVNDIRASCHFGMDNAAHRFAADDLPVFLPPSGAASHRMLACFEWVSALEEEQRHLLWTRASHEPWKDICAWMGCDRTTAWRRWNGALEALVGLTSSAAVLHLRES